MSVLAAAVGLEPDPIREVSCFDCSVPLPRPLIVGRATVTRRTYAVVRIRTQSGLEGAAYAFARYLCRDATAAEDVVQDAYLRAFRGFHGYHRAQRHQLRRSRAVGSAGKAPGRAARGPARPRSPRRRGLRRGRLQTRGRRRARRPAGGDVRLHASGLPGREAHDRRRRRCNGRTADRRGAGGRWRGLHDRRRRLSLVHEHRGRGAATRAA